MTTVAARCVSLTVFLLLGACTGLGQRSDTPQEAAKRAEDFVWRCELITGNDRLACLDALPWRVPGYFGERTNALRAPAPRR